MNRTANIFATVVFVFVSTYIPENSNFAIEKDDTNFYISESHNLVPNPSFEEGADMPTGWFSYDDDSTNYWNSSIAHSGNRSVCINEITPYGQGRWGTTEKIPVAPGKSYEISYWAIGENEAGYTAAFEIANFDENGEFLVESYAAIDFINSGWTEKKTILTTHPNAASVQLWLFAWNMNSYPSPTFNVCFDDLSFNKEREGNWTLFYYLAADNNLEGDISSEYRNIAQSQINNGTNVAVFLDVLGTQARYHGFTPNGQDDIQWLGESNTGDPQTLIDFINWGKTEYPSDNYALIIEDHGHALGGVAVDETPPSGTFVDSLTPRELKQSLSATGPFNVIFMRTCLMGNTDIEYEIRGSANYYIGSEAIEWGTMQHNDYIDVVDDYTGSMELSLLIAYSYFNAVGTKSTDGNNTPSTISVVDLTKIESVATKASELALKISEQDYETRNLVWNIMEVSNLQRFDESDPLGIDTNDRFADLYHFALLVNELGNGEISAAASDLVNVLNEYIIYNWAWNGNLRDNSGSVFYNHENAYGVSITLPINSNSFYTFEWLDFAEGAEWGINEKKNIQKPEYINSLMWGPLVVDMVRTFNPEASDNPNPPEPIPYSLRYELFIPYVNRN